ncbi:MAG: HAD family hydrolase [Bacteroidales bacterium]|jgi:phosphoglycolate phosphatase|nr:HAD family hydrolase [Bacteroidales bacterium]
MIKNILFDFDGTLADTSEGIVRCTQATLREMGLPASTPGRIRATIGLPLGKCFEDGTDTPPERVEEACQTYRRLFNEIAIPCITLFDGVAETIAALHAEGLRFAICTSRSSASLLTLLEENGIGAYFSAHTSNDDVHLLRAKPKPAPDLALLLLGRLGARAEESLVVGDTVFDLEMGRGAGCRTCGVTYGNQDRTLLERAAPDALIDRITELPGVLRNE